MRRLALVALAVLAAASCRPREAEKAETPPAPQPAPVEQPQPTAIPLTYESKTPFAEVKLTLPREIATVPDLHRKVFDEAVRDLRQFNEGAQADRTEYAGREGMPPYSQFRDWTLAAQTPRLFSMKAAVSEYTGGAHPNNGYGAVLWDKAQNRELQPAALFRQGFDQAALNRALCDAVTRAKRERIGADAPPFPNESWKCPAWTETAIVLAPSRTPGKAGGLTFLIGPYLVGPYAEGGYEITLPTATIRPWLAPEYADQFA
ncbi:DUF4163 domain-containing protein [Brevundimonas sp. 2R-24]|uniref:DUF4163 domain-containing protein n=1 Tax=Peiella sedimenti TaxID=3061083 RepID=A0ABT8SLC7_9CAUL|nr:DUF4163 domain-containing protein [Caulobacteraceae bacterium XZ-24]